MKNATEYSVTVYDHRGNAMKKEVRSIIEESALVIGVNGVTDYTIMRTPGNDRELTAGFLLTECIVDSIDDILMLQECAQAPNSITVETGGPTAGSVYRNLVINSSCGLCGRSDLEALLKGLVHVSKGIAIPHSVLYGISKRVFPAQQLFRSTGAAHAAALFDAKGKIFVVREDVGRHNAMDKVIGAALLREAPLSKMGVFLSGRASLELIVKAARGGISLVLSVSAPTEAALTIADKLGIALVGFARESGFTIYTHPERIIFAEEPMEIPIAASLG